MQVVFISIRGFVSRLWKGSSPYQARSTVSACSLLSLHAGEQFSASTTLTVEVIGNKVYCSRNNVQVVQSDSGWYLDSFPEKVLSSHCSVRDSLIDRGPSVWEVEDK